MDLLDVGQAVHRAVDDARRFRQIAGLAVAVSNDHMLTATQQRLYDSLQAHNAGPVSVAELSMWIDEGS